MLLWIMRLCVGKVGSLVTLKVMLTVRFVLGFGSCSCLWLTWLSATLVLVFRLSGRLSVTGSGSVVLPCNGVGSLSVTLIRLEWTLSSRLGVVVRLLLLLLWWIVSIRLYRVWLGSCVV